MKLPSLAAAVIVIAVLVAGYVLGSDYLGARKEASTAASEVAAAMVALGQAPLPPADTGRRRDAAEGAVAGAEGLFPEPDAVSALVAGVLSLAGSAGVRTEPLVVGPWTTENVAGVAVPVLRFSVTAGGPYADLRAFLAALEADGPPGLVLGEVTLTALNISENGFIMDVQGAVYGRPAGSGP